MPTALDLVKRSMRLVGALGGGETPTADEQTDGLVALNSMLDAWSIQRLNVYQVQDESFTWASGNATRTMGTGGDFDTDKPAEVVGFFQRINDVDYPISKARERQYNAIPDKATQSSVITWIYPEMGASLVTLYAYPVPSTDATVHIQSWVALQSFAAATTALALPAGYEEAIVHNLAVTLAPEYDRKVPPHVFRKAAAGMRAIKRRNTVPINSVSEPAFMSEGVFDWRTGD